MKNDCKTRSRADKRAYVKPIIERREKLEDVTEGVQQVVTGAAPAD